ncbi:hypothetical protein Pogu_2046 [Pyrobaculum oguniense TE7]|uniref:Uncharacterized protein n=1 Tax=Pyrobaculum oguniense (strain DSM 13380 / JCM 10595 / TE7) TaxID=698757 RepID=H6QB76_PYROT|nr:hypothetical protein Pogu_2046 [Pyrobaculum oguniense TE7]
MSLGEELVVGFALGFTVALNEAIDVGALETPYKFPFGLAARILAEMFIWYAQFRRTILNLLWLVANSRTPRLLLGRLLRRSY